MNDINLEMAGNRKSLFPRSDYLYSSDSSEYYRKYVFINYLYFSCFITHMTFALIFKWIEANNLISFCLINACVYLFCILLNIKGFYRSGLAFFAVEVHLFILLCCFIFGDVGFQYYLFPVVALLFLISFENETFRLVWAVTDSLIFVGLNYYVTKQQPQGDFEPYALEILRFVNTYATFFFLGFAGYYSSQYAIKVEKTLKKIATTDTLTGLSNRRDFISKIQVEMARFDRSKKSFSVVMGDIDHFKKFNDTFGHKCGDYVLHQIAQIIKNSLRQQDSVGRWGGEEFILLLPETNLKEGDKVAEKIRNTIASNSFTYQKNKLTVTMSFGVSVYTHAVSMEEIIDKADKCLYFAKDAGRNRVISLLE